MKQPRVRVSIVIPAYNEERHLDRCLQAIARQTVRPFEVLVVDNNSTDETVAIARRYAFVRVLHEPLQGISYTRDAGFNAARGDIIGRIDADTVLPPDWTTRVQDFYIQPAHARQALTGGGWFYNAPLPWLNGWLQGQVAFRMNRLIAGHYILWGSNMALPVSLWQAVHADVCHRSNLHEDMDLATHLHRKGFAITYDESLRAGVYLKRLTRNHAAIYAHMHRWPQTLRVHGYKLWWVGVVGNMFLWFIVRPFAWTIEGIKRLFGRGTPQ